MARILMPLPDHGFDVTEVAVPWRVLTDAGHEVVIATETGAVPSADPLLLTGVVFGQLGAAAEPIEFYREFERSPARNSPPRWSELDVVEFDGLLLPGGHARAMRQYLGNQELQTQVARFWALDRPVAAICHGVLVLARATDINGVSVLARSRTTCLPKYMERSAYLATFWKLGRYYRTYDAYVEEEVRAALAQSDDFVRGPFEMSTRGTDTDDAAAFVVEDGSYVSARWPGDAYLFAKKLMARLQ